jgi:hypothetical protein
VKRAKDIAGAYLSRASEEFAKRTSSTKRLASGIRSVLGFDDLDLSEKERATLNSAVALLGDIATTYAQAAALKKRAEARCEKRKADVLVAMKDNFAALTGTADCVALLAFISGWTFDADQMGGERHTHTLADAKYLLGDFLRRELGSLAWTIASSEHASVKDLPPAGAVATWWQLFQQKRAALQDKHAAAIVRLERLLTEAHGVATC